MISLITWLLSAVGWVISAALGLVWYLVTSFAYYKALKRLMYCNTWMSFIPYVRNFALTDAVCVESTVNLGFANISSSMFKLWVVLAFLVGFIPKFGSFASILVTVICLGYTLTRVYAIIDSKPFEDERIMGYLSGAFPIIAIIRFLFIR